MRGSGGVLGPVDDIEIKVSVALCAARVDDDLGTDAAEVDALWRLDTVEKGEAETTSLAAGPSPPRLLRGLVAAAKSKKTLS
eukprot:973686-Pleurochrysis_carterae.AAC.1